MPACLPPRLHMSLISPHLLMAEAWKLVLALLEESQLSIRKRMKTIDKRQMMLSFNLKQTIGPKYEETFMELLTWD